MNISGKTSAKSSRELEGIPLWGNTLPFIARRNSSIQGTQSAQLGEPSPPPCFIPLWLAHWVPCPAGWRLRDKHCFAVSKQSSWAFLPSLVHGSHHWAQAYRSLGPGMLFPLQVVGEQHRACLSTWEQGPRGDTQ